MTGTCIQGLLTFILTSSSLLIVISCKVFQLTISKPLRRKAPFWNLHEANVSAFLRSASILYIFLLTLITFRIINRRVLILKTKATNIRQFHLAFPFQFLISYINIVILIYIILYKTTTRFCIIF